MPTVQIGDKRVQFPDTMGPETIADVLGAYSNAAVEVGSMFGSAVVAEPIAGLTALATNDPDAVGGMMERMVYQPKTREGQRAIQAIGSGIQSFAEKTGLEHMPGYWRDRVVPALQDQAGPGLGSALAAGSLASFVAMMEMFGGKGNKAIPKGQRGTFGSVKAKTADLDALESAKSKGKYAKYRAWEEDGWYQDVDGKWKFEIDDSKARVVSDGTGRLEESLDHPKLFEAYPELRNWNVEFTDLEGANGRQLPGRNTVQVDRSLQGDRQISTLLHEIQHGIQEIEDFAVGGNPESAKLQISKQLYQNKKPVAADNAKYNAARLEYSAASDMDDLLYLRELSVRDNITPRMITRRGDYYWGDMSSEIGDMPKRSGWKQKEWLRNAAAKLYEKKYEKLQEAARNGDVSAIDVIERRMQTNPSRKELKNEMRRLDRRLDKTRDGAIEYSKATRQQESLEKMTDLEAYDRLAGEVEARNVQNRQYMTEGERRAEFPHKTISQGRYITPFLRNRGLVAEQTFPVSSSSWSAGFEPSSVKPKITAYHGSPHDFDKFSMSQIGTGEGAQAYGHGFYFAESEDVARGYRDALQKGSGATDDDVMARAIQAHDGDLEAAAKSLGERGNRLMESDPDKAQRFYQMQMRVMGGHNPSGRMYQVEIDASPDEFLDWDKPLSEQSEAVRKALGYSDNPNLDPKKKAYVDDFLKYDSMTEQDLYESLTFSDDYVKGMSPEDANVLVEYAKANRVRGDEMVTPEFAERARQAGIKGIRYKDGFSRGAEGGTSNYVVFDENIISIAKKYGIAIPAAAAMLYGDKADQYYEKEA